MVFEIPMCMHVCVSLWMCGIPGLMGNANHAVKYVCVWLECLWLCRFHGRRSSDCVLTV